VDRVERQNVGLANRIFVSADGMNFSSLTLFTKCEAFFLDDLLKHAHASVGMAPKFFY
jgi:hypothetical protein